MTVPLAAFIRTVYPKIVFVANASLVLTDTVATAVVNTGFILTVLAFVTRRAVTGAVIALPSV